jgi:hypothetical protein
MHGSEDGVNLLVNLLGAQRPAHPLLAQTRVVRLIGAGGGPRTLGIADLEEAGMLGGISAEMTADIANAFVPIVSGDEWRARTERLPQLPEEEAQSLPVWTAAVPLDLDSRQLVLVPHDASPVPSVQLFVRRDDGGGRLIITGTQYGETFLADGATVEAPAHCKIAPCDSYEPCGGECEGCHCARMTKDGVSGTCCNCPHM